MCTTRLQRDIPVRASSSSSCLLLLCLLLFAAHARAVVGQGDIPAKPQEVADFFVQLLTAKQVDVKTLLAATQADLPYFRLRLYVAPTVSGQAGQAASLRHGSVSIINTQTPTKRTASNSRPPRVCFVTVSTRPSAIRCQSRRTPKKQACGLSMSGVSIRAAPAGMFRSWQRCGSTPRLPASSIGTQGSSTLDGCATTICQHS
jgi:hypothetical protein